MDKLRGCKGCRASVQRSVDGFCECLCEIEQTPLRAVCDEKSFGLFIAKYQLTKSHVRKTGETQKPERNAQQNFLAIEGL